MKNSRKQKKKSQEKMSCSRNKAALESGIDTPGLTGNKM